MRAEPIPRIGPFQTQGSGSWLFACAATAISCALIGYVALLAVSLSSVSMTCSMQVWNGLLLAVVLGMGVGFLLATAFRSRTAKLIASAAAGLVASAVGFLIVQVIYAPHCQSSIPGVQRLLSL